MNKTWLLIAVFALLGYAFVSSPPFQTIAAGVAIFLFGMLFLEEGFQAIIDFATRALVAGNSTILSARISQR